VPSEFKMLGQPDRIESTLKKEGETGGDVGNVELGQKKEKHRENTHFPAS